MSPKKVIQSFFSLSLACILTAGLYLFETRYAENRRIQSLLQWSRQLTQQAEALSLYAREKTETDPISWAVKYLMVGDEYRPIWIKPFIETKKSENIEDFSYGSAKGEFFYSKVLNPVTRQGVQIQIHAGYLGFLGSPSTGANDFLILLTFLLLLSSIEFLLNKTLGLAGPPDEELAEFRRLVAAEEQALERILNPPPVPQPILEVAIESDLKNETLEWVQEARQVLVGFGVHLKSLTQEARNLIEVVAKSKEALALTLGTSIKIGEKAEDLEFILLEPQENIEHLKEASSVMTDLISKTSVQINATFQTYDEVFEISQRFSSSLTKTTEALGQESKLMQDFKQKLSSERKV